MTPEVLAYDMTPEELERFAVVFDFGVAVEHEEVPQDDGTILHRYVFRPSTVEREP